ncbi:hypothetical protein DBZ36_16915 [Alginatibacterium sediminis]|uniref:Uncharacterized protein n=1 Tax=Alginatibacterium sediminis TaxID=2164068 RepID=A0A420E7E0_9ALTE|nr:hypothetical protein [Alginatibacterium sediminis]RKF14338.1 hypothetical protein DBZ36_16915 [Alginatibacterium sediminis]
MKKKIITEKELPIVEDVLTKWSGKLTWPAFAEALAKRLNRASISTFTLMGDAGIKQAFQRRKKTLKDAKSQMTSETGDVTIDALLKENSELKGQIDHLKAEHSVKEKIWKETFIRWQYNLSQMPNVDMSKLQQEIDKPFHKTDRDA